MANGYTGTFNGMECDFSIGDYIQKLKKQSRRAQKLAIKKAGQIVLNQTRKNLLSEIPSAKNKNPKYSDTIYDAPRLSIFSDYYKEQAKVHIMGSRKKDSGTFRAKMLEVGSYKTGKRTTKKSFSVKQKDGTIKTYPKGQNRGVLKGRYFFKKAVQSTKSKAEQVLKQTLSDLMAKIK